MITINDCVKMNHTFCVAGGNYRMIPYFCGNATFCQTPTEQGLKRAIVNVDKYFLVVGVLEQYELFLKLCQKMMPTYFQGILQLYGDKRDTINYSGKTKYKELPSVETVNFLKNTLQMKFEYLFYHHVIQRFNSQLVEYSIS